MNIIPSLSIIVPVYNEEESIEKLFAEIRSVCVQNNYESEIIFVDDGSTDGTRDVLLTKCSPIKYIGLRRNFGQTSAMDAGIKAAKNDYIVMLDGDGQNDPADIPALIKYLEDNKLDVVSGWRKHRKDKLFKRFSSRVANILRSIIVRDHIHDSGCTLKVYRRECFKYINLYGEMHRFIPALLKIKGFSVGEIVVNHRPRTKGKSKYTWKRALKGFLDMISIWFWHKFAVRPFHLMGGFGAITLFLGAVFGVWSIVLAIMGKSLTDNFHPMLSIAFLITGLLLVVFGLLADMMTKIYFGSELDMPYSVREEVENDH